jgi:arginyl-tRNA synthetase
LNGWFYDQFYTSFQLLGSYADHYWYESEFFKKAKELAQKGLEKGVFKKLEDGAVLTQLESYGLTDDIVQRSDGTAMYFTQDLYLTKMKTEMFPSDKYIWVVGPEQKLHMKQVFAVCDQLGIGNIDKFIHLSYGAVCNKDGSKMSSRNGDVLSIMDLLNELKQTIVLKKEKEYISLNNFNEEEQCKIIESLSLGAIKYAILKLEKEQDLRFDLNEILDLKGNGSPYIQYTYARCFSILEKVDLKEGLVEIDKITDEENVLLRDFLYLKEVVEKSGINFAPNLITNYLFEISRDFNNFYEKNRIIEAEYNQILKINLTKSVANVLK